MKVIGGKFKGRNLARVGAIGQSSLRPTSSKVRGSIFNMLVNGRNGNLVEGARVLDLFAGTGALGVEALSRGAAHVTFVEIESSACQLIRRNIELTGSIGNAVLLKRDARRLGRNRSDPFDLIFLDPPYGKGFGSQSIESALAQRWVSSEAVAVIEESAAPDLSGIMEAIESRKHGETTVTLYRRLPGMSL